MSGVDERSALWLSTTVAMASVLLSLPFALGLGRWLARSTSRFAILVEAIADLGLVIPPVATGYILLVLLGRHGWLGSILREQLGIEIAFTWWGAVVASVIVGFPLLLRPIKLGFASIDPKFEMVARTLGTSEWMIFWRVCMPLCWPGIMAGMVLCFARSLGEFGATIVFAGNIKGETQTIPLAIYSLLQQPGGDAACYRLILISVLISLAALIFAERLAPRNPRRG